MENQKIFTKYDHSNKITISNYCCNCYGFVNYLVAETRPEAFENLLELMNDLTTSGIKASLDPGQPSPENYFYIFKSLFEGKLESRYWIGIDDIYHIIIGDIVAYLPPNYSSPLTLEKSIEKPTGTHVMIVSDILQKTLQAIKIRVIDSSFQAHHDIDDTRYLYGMKSGIGEATMLIKKSDKPRRYLMQWGNQPKITIKEFFAGRSR